MAEKPNDPKPQPPELPPPPVKVSAIKPGAETPEWETPWMVVTHQALAQRYGNAETTCQGAMGFDRMQVGGGREMTMDANCAECKQTMTLRFSDQKTGMEFFLGFFTKGKGKKGKGKK